MLTVHGVYFSATGTTEKTVRCTAAAAADFLGTERREFCFNLPRQREQALVFGKDDLVIFGIPVYAGRVPNLLLPYIKEKLSGGGAAAVPLVLFGNRNFDDALIELRDLLEACGFRTVAAGAFAGAHAFSRILGAGRPDEADMALAEELGRRAAEMFLRFESVNCPVDVPGNQPPAPYYTPRDRHGNPIDILKVRPKTDAEACGNCGLCAELCPLGSIAPEDPSNISGICMKCGACVKKCPSQAKYFDDPGYLYHRKELEEMYERRAESRIFFAKSRILQRAENKITESGSF